MNKKLRVLILEDQPTDAELALRELRRAGYEPEWKRVMTERDYLAELDQGWEIILADYQMPQFTGVEALELLKARGRDIPLVLISGTVGEDVAVGAMKSGASDYLMKGHLARLGQVVERELREAAVRGEQRRMEAAMRDNEERYRALFDRSMDCVFLNDFDGRFLDANQAALDLLGYRREDILTLTFASLLTEDQLPLAFQLTEEIKTTGHRKEPTEFRLRGKDGRQVAVEVQSSLIYCEGKPYAIQGIARDLTTRKLAEREVQRQAAFACYNPNPVLELSATGEILYFNPATLQMASSLGQECPSRILPPSTVEIVRDCLTTNRSNLRLETVQKGRTISWSFFPVAQNNVVHCYAGDVTVRKLVETSHARLTAAVEQAAETIVITNTEGTILYANPAFERSTGYTCAEALGQNPRVLKSGKQDAGFYQKMWNVLNRGEVWTGHFVNRRKDGTIYEEEATISPIRDANGKVINYVAVKRDVTREVQLEAQFRQSQKMEAIGTLASGVAHDFNNILAVIQMQAELLKLSGDLSVPQTELASEIVSAVKRAAALTRQLLVFSRKENLQSRDLDLNESVANLTKMLTRILGENIEMQVKPENQPMLVHADAGMMDQVLMNLVVNARDAMPGGGKLIIATSRVDLDEFAASQVASARPGSFVCLSVSDTGGGIPPEILPRIFEPFFTTKDVGKGTGLGLATVFGIVQQHQGWINLSSIVGEGTTFKIYLPRLTEKQDTELLRKTPSAVQTGTETILLVEDEPALRTTIRVMLTRLGYRVLEASTGVKALEIWRAHRPEIHLLLTDLMMPGGMSGKDLAQRIMLEHPQLKAVYLSGYSGEIVGKDFPLIEGVNFLTKPFEAKKLAQILRAVLDEPAGEGAGQLK